MSLSFVDPSLVETHIPSPDSHPRNRRLRKIVKFVAEAIPTLVVLALAGLIGWWGHHSGWKLPKFSELNGKVAPVDDWCAEHNVPESICVECDPTLMPAQKARGWCKIHGVAECLLEHPELAQLSPTPVVTTADLERAARSLAFTDRKANNPNCQTHLRRIQFVSAKDAEKTGVAVEPVWTNPALEFVAAPGEIGYDQTKVRPLVGPFARQRVEGL